MDKDEKKTKQVILNITQSVLNFLCFDEGDRLACKICILIIVFHIITHECFGSADWLHDFDFGDMT